jgi:hypothetical protein
MSDPSAFKPFIDTEFLVGDYDIPLRLVDVSEGPDSGPVQQFSLFFHGTPDVVLPQGTYRFRYAEDNSVEWFMVPIAGSNRERIVYQVCFNLLKQ